MFRKKRKMFLVDGIKTLKDMNDFLKTTGGDITIFTTFEANRGFFLVEYKA